MTFRISFLLNPGTAEFVIVMEDLCNLTMVDQVAGMSERCVRCSCVGSNSCDVVE